MLNSGAVQPGSHRRPIAVGRAAPVLQDEKNAPDGAAKAPSAALRQPPANAAAGPPRRQKMRPPKTPRAAHGLPGVRHCKSAAPSKRHKDGDAHKHAQPLSPPTRPKRHQQHGQPYGLPGSRCWGAVVPSMGHKDRDQQKHQNNPADDGKTLVGESPSAGVGIGGLGRFGVRWVHSSQSIHWPGARASDKGQKAGQR